MASSCRRAASSLSTKNGKGEGDEDKEGQKAGHITIAAAVQHTLGSAVSCPGCGVLSQTGFGSAQQADRSQAQTQPGLRRPTASRRCRGTIHKWQGNCCQPQPTRTACVAPVPPASDAIRQHRAFKLAVRLEGGKPRVSRVQAQLRLRGKQTDRFHVQVCSLILQRGTTFCYGSCSVGLKHRRGPNRLQPRHSPTDDRIALGSECRISQVGQWTENRMTFPKL